MMIELTALLARAESAEARRRKAADETAARREAADLVDDRRRAQRATSEILEVETVLGDWHRLELPEAPPIHTSKTVWYPTDDDEIRLAFRHRGITAGGDVLTVLALAVESGDWVASSGQISDLASLPAVRADARWQADRYDETVAEVEGEGEDGIAPGETPIVTIRGSSAAEILALAVNLVLDEAETS